MHTCSFLVAGISTAGKADCVVAVAAAATTDALMQHL